MAKYMFVFLSVILLVPRTLCQFDIEDYHGIPNVPPPGVEEHHGIPIIRPPGADDDVISTIRPVLKTFLTPLPYLTPVPATVPNESVFFGNHEPCEKEGGKRRCVVVEECMPFAELLQRPLNASERQELEKAHCGFQGSKAKVCCPRADASLGSPTEDTESIKPTQATPRSNETEDSQNRQTDDDYIDSFPEPPVCGVTNASFTKVIGGVNAKLGDFPWMAYIYYRNEPAHCGGSLVSNKHVLTAAHCIHRVEEKLYLVRLGELDLASDDDGATPLDIHVKSMIKHEKFNPNTNTNDIGLLVLQRHVIFTSLIRPICIPFEPEFRERSFVGYNPIIAGWGVTYGGSRATHLQTVQVPVVSNEECSYAFKQYKEVVIDKSVLCAGAREGGKDSCRDDSGGPLMQQIFNGLQHTTYFYQTGVVSYGKGCGEAGFPGIYTRVTYFVPWLEEKILRKV